MEVSLLSILMLDPDVPGQVHDRLEADGADLLDALVSRQNVRLETLAGGKLSSALPTLVTNFLLVRQLFVHLQLLTTFKEFFADLTLEPGDGINFFLCVEQDINTV